MEIFPTPLDDVKKKIDVGVKKIKVDGVFKGRINRLEIDEVVKQAKNCILPEYFNTPSVNKENIAKAILDKKHNLKKLSKLCI